MKKLLSIILVTVLAVSALGVLPVSAAYPGNGLYEYDTPNQTEQEYNISYYTFVQGYDDNVSGKVMSYQELAARFSENQGILSKYNESFFNDKFLYLIGENVGDTSCYIRVNDVTVDSNGIDVAYTYTDYEWEADQVVVPWTVFVEFDKALADKEIKASIAENGGAGCGGGSFPTEYWTATDADKPEVNDGYCEIRTPENLVWYAENTECKADIKLMNDIDLGGKLWKPIEVLHGEFYGQNHTIKNLTINSTEPYQGLVGKFVATSDYGYIQDLNITNASVFSSGDYVGILAGYNFGDIKNCYVSGYVQGKQYVGGLVGCNSRLQSGTYSFKLGGTISNSSASADVYGEFEAGGLVGWNRFIISRSSADSRIQSGKFRNRTPDDALPKTTGGLVGDNEGSIRECYASGYTSGSEFVGGVVGSNSGRIDNCYATGSVYNIKTVDKNLEIMERLRLLGITAYTGGLAGNVDTGGVVSNSYSACSVGAVEGTNYINGFMGGGTPENCYFDYEISGCGQPKERHKYYVCAKTTAEMKSADIVATLNAGGEEKWAADPGINGGYPVLKWQADKVKEAYCSAWVELDPELYADLTTDEIWNAMHIQVYVSRNDYMLTIKDGDKYYKAGSVLPKLAELYLCDIDKDGTKDLLFTTQVGSGVMREYLWCYSKTKDIWCSFGYTLNGAEPLKFKDNGDGTHSVVVLGKYEGVLALEEDGAKTWLKVDFSDYDAMDEIIKQGIADAERIRTERNFLSLKQRYVGNNQIDGKVDNAAAKFTVDANLPVSLDELVILAIYKGDKMIAIQQKNGEGKKQFVFELGESVDSDCVIKAMVWKKGELTPVSEVYRYTKE